MVGMRPLERSLEKLDDVRKKKLSDMIGSSGGAEASTSGSGVKILLYPSPTSNSSASISSHGVATKKSGAIKTSVKKADGVGQSKTSGSIETEDVEKKKRKRRKRRRGGGEVPRAALAATPPGGRSRAVAARAALAPSTPVPPTGFFLPTRERI
ncbi:hypothetical protein BHE74_00009171 [Ensete ventricosum]|nr:hypothetical protein GW17_00022824 [Ensete ventricosum]RWW82372.1 hypothetical protein BHE74_00009171 [Ensete ventricosum]